MTDSEKLKLRSVLKQNLTAVGDDKDFSDDASLFISGRLDSLAMTNLVLYLEKEFNVDFSTLDFDVELIDSVNDIMALVNTHAVKSA